MVGKPSNLPEAPWPKSLKAMEKLAMGTVGPAPDQGISCQIQSCRQWNLTLTNESSLAGLLEELDYINCNVIGLCEFRRTNVAYTVLRDGHVLCDKDLTDRKERAVGFLINKNLVGNIDFFSISERVAGIVIKWNIKSTD